MTRYSLRLVNPAGTVVGMLPNYSNISMSSIFTDIGTCSFDYQINGVNVGSLVDQQEIAVYDDQGEVPNTRFVIEGGNGNRYSKDGVFYRSWSGRTLHKSLGKALVYSPGWPGDGGGPAAFVSSTPGSILSNLMSRAKALGELSGFTWDFNTTVDSGGVAWPTVYSISYKMGTSILQVLQNMADQGMAEFRLVGRTIQVYRPGGLGTDRSVAGAGQVALLAGNNTHEVPEQTTSKDLATVAIVEGDNGTFVEVVDPLASGTAGRQTMYLTQSGTKDTGTLRVVGQAALDKVKQIRSERTYKYNMLPGTPTPHRTFIPGDWVLQEMPGRMDKVRVRQMSIDVDLDNPNGVCTLTLNDLLLEREIVLNRQVAGITGGASGSGGVPVSNTDTADTLAPAIPIGITYTSQAYIDGGRTYAVVTASWQQVTANTDGSVCDDLDHYEIQWKYNSEARYDRRLSTSGTTVGWSPVSPLSTISFQVRAVDRTGNAGGWSTVSSLTTVGDAVAPPVPSTPSVVPWLGSLRVSWDGLGSSGETMPPDFAYTEVHISTTSGFTPSSATLADTFMTAVSTTLTGLTPGQARYVKLISVDTAGNKSNPSAQGSGTAAYIGTDSIGADAIGLPQISFKDAGNFIQDGSFETVTNRNVMAGFGWTPVGPGTDVSHGQYSMKYTFTGASTGQPKVDLAYTEFLPWQTGDNYWVRLWSKWSSTIRSTVDILVFRIYYYTASKTYISALQLRVTAPHDGTWQDWQGFLPGTTAAPANAEFVKLGIYFDPNQAATDTGTVQIDGMEARRSVGTAIIEDAAITNAKILNLAANKITAGSVIADLTVAARIKTADTGARVELNAAGLQAFNTANTRTVFLSAADGTFSATGDVATGTPGVNRVYMSGNARVPAGSSSALPGISLDVIDQPAGSVQASLLVYPRQAPNSFRGENSIQLLSYRRSISPDSGATRFALSNSGFEIASQGTSGDDYGGRSFYIVGDRRSGAILDIMADSVLRLETDFWSIGHADGKTWSTGIWSYTDGSIHLTNIGYTTGAQMPNGDFYAYDISNRNGTATDNNRGGKFRGNQRMDGDGNKQGAGVLSSGTYGNDGIWFSYASGQFRIWVNGVCVAYMVANGTAYGY